MDNPGFDLLREVFAKFAAKHDGEDLTNRVVRSLAAGGKAAVEKGLEEFPATYIKTVAEDFYAMVTSQELADGVSMTARSFDEEKVKEVLDSALTQLQNDDTALKVAKQLKDMLSKTSTDDIENSIDALMSGRSLGEKMVFKAFFEQARPIIDGMRDASEEEIADQIKELAATIPTDGIAQQVGAMTREITPERVAKQAHDFVGTLPSPGAISDIVQGVGKAASKAFGGISDANGAKNALADFVSEAGDLVRETIANDNASKKTFKKKGGQDFSL
ncbi:MAG: hypothetical protein GC185_01660 [Alphaproteobacteria bacterium]|nr:hypothetical protein [Alphaproteobacteria bacterium]